MKRKMWMDFIHPWMWKKQTIFFTSGKWDRNSIESTFSEIKSTINLPAEASNTEEPGLASNLHHMITLIILFSLHLFLSARYYITAGYFASATSLPSLPWTNGVNLHLQLQTIMERHLVCIYVPNFFYIFIFLWVVKHL